MAPIFLDIQNLNKWRQYLKVYPQKWVRDLKPHSKTLGNNNDNQLFLQDFTPIETCNGQFLTESEKKITDGRQPR
jgi:hypothetical protein